MKWFLAEMQCAICNSESLDLYPELATTCGLECFCGYMMPVEAEEAMEVPESFAKAEHERFGLSWRDDD